ncbi:MAG: 30S ribosomal protein S6 [Bacteroidetes bacterium]|nr:MAG: 30S ribosomal protein S6 [Bacteroidota bacterium]
MLNRYETVFILTPVLSEDQVKEAVKKYHDLITKAGGKIMNEENWGLRKLAYNIRKKSTGFYNLVEFQTEGKEIQDYEVAFKRDEKILRFLTVKLDKHAEAYATRRIKKKKDAAKAKN